MKKTGLALLILCRLGVCADWFAGSPASAPLAAVHRAFLRKESDTLSSAVLSLARAPGSTSLEITNALMLWRTSLGEIAPSSLPSQWTTQSTVKRLRIVERKVEQNGETLYQTVVQGDPAAIPIRELSLADRAGKLLLDKHAGPGEWRLFETKAANQPFGFELRSEWRHAALPDGVYAVRIAREDGVNSEDWLPVGILPDRAVPSILAPSSGQVVTTASPMARWLSLAAFAGTRQELELRVLRLQAASETFDERLGPWWGAFPDSAMRSLPIGTRFREGGFGEPDLQTGAYALRVAYTDVLALGPTELARESARVIRFRVRR